MHIPEVIKEHKVAFGIGAVVLVLIVLRLRKVKNDNAQIAATGSTGGDSTTLATPLTTYPVSGGYSSGGYSAGSDGLSSSVPSLSDVTGGSATTDPLGSFLAAYLLSRNSNTGTATAPAPSPSTPATAPAVASGSSVDAVKNAVYQQLYKNGITTANAADVMNVAKQLGYSVDTIGQAFGLNSAATNAWLVDNNTNGGMPSTSNVVNTVGTSSPVYYGSSNNTDAATVKSLTGTTVASNDLKSQVYGYLSSNGITDAQVDHGLIDTLANKFNVTPTDIGQAFGMTRDQAISWYLAH